METISSVDLYKLYHGLIDTYEKKKKEIHELEDKIITISDFGEILGVNLFEKKKPLKQNKTYPYRSTWAKKIIYSINQFEEVSASEIVEYLIKEEPNQTRKHLLPLVSNHLYKLKKTNNILWRKKVNDKGRLVLYYSFKK